MGVLHCSIKNSERRTALSSRQDPKACLPCWLKWVEWNIMAPLRLVHTTREVPHGHERHFSRLSFPIEVR